MAKSSKAKKLVYVGPFYINGLILPSGKTVFPKAWDEKTRKHYAKIFPPSAEWFAKPAEEKSESTSTDAAVAKIEQ